MSVWETFRALYDSGGKDVEALEATSLEDRITQLGEAERILTAAKALVTGYKYLITEDLGADGYRFGEVAYWVARRPKLRVLDPEAFVEFLGDDLSDVLRIDGGAVRTTGLKALAKKRGLSYQGVQDTFLEITWSDTLATAPLAVTKAVPAWLRREGAGDGFVPRVEDEFDD